MSKKEATVKATHKICLKCGENKPLRDYYRSMSPMYSSDKLLPFCKSCLVNTVEDGTDLEKDAKVLLRQIDRPFLIDIWKSSLEEAKNADKSEFGTYMKNLAMPHCINMTWEDSDYRTITRRGQEGKKDREADMMERENLSESDLDKLEEVWGYGFDPQIYVYFERKYDSLVDNQPINTSLHEEALRTYCVYKVQAELATARGDIKDAKEWATLAQRQGEIAKINPNKLTKDDLSQGVSSFSEVSRLVEKEVEIIPILPRFIAKPNDALDVAILSFINYARRMKGGLEDIEHHEIYDFYQDNLKNYLEDSTKSEEIKKKIKEIEIITENGNKKTILFYDVYEVIEQRKKEQPNNKFIQNLDKWMELVSYFKWFPCAFYKLMEAEEGGGIKLDSDQEFILRCLARFPKNYTVFPRGFGKTMIEVMSAYHACILTPNLDYAMTAQTKENSASLIGSKWKEIERSYPMIKDELIEEPRISKDVAIVKFKSGSVLDNLANARSSLGQRRKRLMVEEYAQVNNDIFLEVLEPIIINPRFTLGRTGTISPYELNSAMTFITTSWFVNTTPYEKSLDMYDKMINLEGNMVLGADWLLASAYGRGAERSSILDRKANLPPLNFAMNYESRWVGVTDGALVSINSVMDLRTLSKAEAKGARSAEYVIGVDVARSESTANNQCSVAVVRIKRNEDGRISILQLVNLINIPSVLNFKVQAQEVMKIRNKYNAKAVVVDGNGLGKH